MKTYKNLYPQITEFENLYQSFKKAARGKRKKSDVAAFEYNLEANLLALQEELKSESYHPGAYFNFRIQDPKPRLISAAPFRDRVVHHALCNVIEPIWESRFIHDTYACRVGKGTHAALHQTTEFSRRYPYVLQCDLEHFFPSMDHEILHRELTRLVADKKAAGLCKKILDSGASIHKSDYEMRYFSGDTLLAANRPRGLPIGNLTSQFWGNVYLNPLDQFIKRELKCKGYIRYVDDFLLFDKDKKRLHEWREVIMQFLAGLRLTLHEKRAVVFPVETGIPFLGWRTYPTHRKLRRHNGVRFQRRFAAQRKAFLHGELSFEKLDASVQAWIAHLAHGNTWGLRRSLLNSPLLTPIALSQTREG